MNCLECPPGQLLACPLCHHDIHRHNSSIGCTLCSAAWVPGVSTLDDMCNLAPPFIGDQSPITKEKPHDCSASGCDYQGAKACRTMEVRHG